MARKTRQLIKKGGRKTRRYRKGGNPLFHCVEGICYGLTKAGPFIQCIGKECIKNKSTQPASTEEQRPPPPNHKSTNKQIGGKKSRKFNKMRRKHRYRTFHR